jgi:hypothetical protein
MPSLQSSQSSLESHCSQLKLHHKHALVESTLLSLPCTLPLDHFFSEDPVALSLITAYRSTDLSSSYAHTINTPEEEATKCSIIYHMTKIKLILADQLLERGFEQALTPSMIHKITKSRHGSCGPFGPTPMQPMHSPSLDVPSSPSEASDESTPVPLPSSQLAIHSSRAPCKSCGKRRNTVTFRVGLSQPYTPSPAPLIKEEDSEPSITPPEPSHAPSPTNFHAPSEETFYDRNGVDYSRMTCHYCGGDGHHQIHCPRYFCRICHNHAPKHLTCFCPKLKGMRIIAARPGSWLFLSQLKAYEDRMDKEYEAIEKRTLADDTYSANLYLNLDN